MLSTEHEERSQWFRFSRAVLEVLQPGMRTLFIQCFNDRFGPVGFTCTDDAAFGDVFVNGGFGVGRWWLSLAPSPSGKLIMLLILLFELHSIRPCPCVHSLHGLLDRI